MVQYDLEGREAPPMPEREFSWPVYDIFTTRDDRQIFIGAVTERQWAVLCGLLGLEDLLGDPGLQNKMQQIEARDRTLPLFAKKVKAWDFGDLVKRLEDGGLPFAPIRRPAEMYDDPHVMRPGGLLVSSLPGGGEIRAPGLPVEIDDVIPAPGSVDIAGLGADTAAVLGDLGLSAEEARAARGAAKEGAA